MNILMTGATGYIGRHVARQLVQLGHDVTAATRRGSARSLPQGVRLVPAGLEQIDAMVAQADKADAVIHLGFASHGRAWSDAVKAEAELIKALTASMAGSGKTMIVANGTAFYGSSNGECLSETATLKDKGLAIRVKALSPVHSTPGIRGIELRFASFVYGEGGSVFLPQLLAVAQTVGRSIYVGEGLNRLSAVHVADAARAVIAVLDHDDASGVYHVSSDDMPTMKDLAEAIAVSTGSRVERIGEDEAVSLTDPFTAMFLSLDNSLSSRRIRSDTGWMPREAKGLLWDVAFGSYRKIGEQVLTTQV